MAKEDEKKPTAADKGKGKSVNGDAEKKKETQKDSNGKPADAQKDAPQAGMLCPEPRSQQVYDVTATNMRVEELNEEDQQLKNDLDMLAERILVC